MINLHNIDGDSLIELQALSLVPLATTIGGLENALVCQYAGTQQFCTVDLPDSASGTVALYGSSPSLSLLYEEFTLHTSSDGLTVHTSNCEKQSVQYRTSTVGSAAVTL